MLGSRFFTALAVLVTAQFSAAYDQQTLFNKLKNSGINYQVDGVICEQVAKIELNDEYPSDRYNIENGIVYGDQNRTIGELDVVVLEKMTGEAVLVAEVKCWNDLDGALAKARNQQNRFKKTIQGRGSIHIRNENGTYNRKQFENTHQYIAISQSGGKSAGFEMELENSLESLRELRTQLMACQARGECKKPQKR